jgi:predicted dehydrogenase
LLHISTQYIYDDDTAITAEGGWAMMPTFGFEMSFNIVLEKATLVYDLTRDPAFRVCPAEGDALTPEVEKSDGWFLQIAHFARAVSGEKVEEITTLDQSMNSVKIVEAEKQSASKGKMVTIS